MKWKKGMKSSTIGTHVKKKGVRGYRGEGVRGRGDEVVYYRDSCKKKGVRGYGGEGMKSSTIGTHVKKKG
jgi:hypothetical protein